MEPNSTHRGRAGVHYSIDDFGQLVGIVGQLGQDRSNQYATGHAGVIELAHSLDPPPGMRSARLCQLPYVLVERANREVDMDRRAFGRGREQVKVSQDES